MNEPVNWQDPPPPCWYTRPRNAIIVLVAMSAVIGVGVGVFAALHTHHHRPAHRHHTSGVHVLVDLASLILLVVFVYGSLWAQRRALRREGMSFWPPSRTLPWAARRELGRTVRRGHPSADPNRRWYEVDLARRLVLNCRYTPFMGIGIFLFFGVRALDPSASGFARVSDAAIIAVWICIVPFVYRQARRARQFLHAASQTPVQNPGRSPQPS